MEHIQIYHESQKTQLSEINTAITEVLRDTKLDRNNSKWLADCLDKYYLRGEEKEAPEVKTLFQFVDRFIAEAPNRKDKQTGRSHKETNIQQYKAGIKHLKAFAETRKKRDFAFEKINQSFYRHFVEFLQAKSFTQISIGKQISVGRYV